MRIRLAALSLGPVLAGLLFATVPVADAAPAPVSKARQKELDRIHTRIAALNTKLEQDREKRDSLDASIEEAEKLLATSQAELNRLTGALATRQAELARAQTDRDVAQASLAREREALGRELRAVYVTGQREQIKLLLSQDTAGALGRLLTYHDYLSRARADRVTHLRDEQDRLAVAEARLQQETADLTQLRLQNQKAVEENSRLKIQRGALLARLNERIGDEEDQLKQLAQDEKDLSRVLDNIKTVLADEPVKTPEKPESDGTPARAFAQGRGRMGWPLRGPLLANYGDPKVGGKLNWKGLWIAADRGAPVRASARGRVAYVGFMHRYGLIVILEHEENYFTLYGHLDNVAVTAGDTVGLGDKVASVGDSGGHDKTGLYFEVRKGTDPLDPREWLSP